jgi:hypothetical protein
MVFDRPKGAHRRLPRILKVTMNARGEVVFARRLEKRKEKKK